MWFGEPLPFPERGSPNRLRASGQQSYEGWSCRLSRRNRFLCYITYAFISFCCGRYRICGWYQETRAGGGGVCESNYPRSRGLGSTHYHNTAGVKALVDPNTLLNIIIPIYTSKLRLWMNCNISSAIVSLSLSLSLLLCPSYITVTNKERHNRVLQRIMMCNLDVSVVTWFWVTE